ncbi:DUF222 domain-containing protein [Kribbella sp. WER1]
MELLGERPAWSMSGSELLSTLDTLDAEIARLESYRLHVIAAVESTGYATELGARDTAELLRFRYRQDATTARRTLRLAQALPKYPSVAAALDDTATPQSETDLDVDAEDEDGGWLLRPAQAEAIVSALDRVPTHVPIEDRDAAERELIGLAAHLSPLELRQAGARIRDLLDTDGPEPEEAKAAARESLTLTPADRGVKFRGYLANENAELFRTLIHTGARPHKTIDGDPDPRSRESARPTLSAPPSPSPQPPPTPATPHPTRPTPPAKPTRAKPTPARTTYTAATYTAAYARTAYAGTACAGTARAGTARAGTVCAGTAHVGTAYAGTARAGTMRAAKAHAGVTCVTAVYVGTACAKATYAGTLCAATASTSVACVRAVCAGTTDSRTVRVRAAYAAGTSYLGGPRSPAGPGLRASGCLGLVPRRS